MGDRYILWQLAYRPPFSAPEKKKVDTSLFHQWQSTMVSGRLNVIKDLKRTNQIAKFGRTRHLICQERTHANIHGPDTTVDTQSAHCFINLSIPSTSNHEQRTPSHHSLKFDMRNILLGIGCFKLRVVYIESNRP